MTNTELVGVLVGLAVASTGFNAVFPGLNVFVLVLPPEAHLESVWWVGMLQGVLVAATYMCLCGREVLVEQPLPREGEDEETKPLLPP